MNAPDKIFGINGPVVTLKGKTDLGMLEMVYVGNKRLVGEVIGLDADRTLIQVYEDTSGLRPGEPVVSSGGPLRVLLGPGIVGNIFDGIQNPLSDLAKESGDFLSKGVNISALDKDKLWQTRLTVKVGDRISGGEIYALVEETPVVEHRLMLSPELQGKVIRCEADGQYKLEDTIVTIEDDKGISHDLKLCNYWPIRTPRPTKNRLPLNLPLVTGQRVIDSLFPIAKGGTTAVPGGFGTGKTVTQHQIAKWCDADIIFYVGCGERGNEMTQALKEFSKIIDPKTGRPLTERTVLIANTSNMPVAAREASIYTGVTLAEYYRDMGYHTALMADSTSRWAEALREISGRLEEMPAEEGFPAYLPSRLSEFYERAGYFETLNGREGSISLIGAVSPQGSDFSEPVTQNTKRFTRCFLVLDKALAYSRHYPAINWTDSYSEYVSVLEPWYEENVGDDFIKNRNRLRQILSEEKELMEIVRLIGADVLPDDQKLTLETARLIRVGFLQQNALNPTDTYVPLEKQLKMMRCILYLHDKAVKLVEMKIPLAKVTKTGIFDSLTDMKYDVPNDDLSKFKDYEVILIMCSTNSRDWHIPQTGREATNDY